MTLTKEQARANIRQAIKNIQNDPGSVDLTRFGTSRHDIPTSYPEIQLPPSCGTPACIAGHICFADSRPASEMTTTTISMVARENIEALGVTPMRRGYNIFGATVADWAPKYQKIATQKGTWAGAVAILQDILDGKYPS